MEGLGEGLGVALEITGAVRVVRHQHSASREIEPRVRPGQDLLDQGPRLLDALGRQPPQGQVGENVVAVD
jgi:hypothetical protein